MNVLVVAAHPDDEVLGCGGTIARLAREGCHVSIAVLGEGVTSRSHRREEADPQLTEKLQEQSRQVADLLGAKKLFLQELPDNRFDTVPLLDIVKLVEGWIEDVQPEAVYTHHGGDLNVDHVITFRAVLTATRPQEGCPIRHLYTFEIPSSTEWSFGCLNDCFNPNLFVDISETLDQKIRALQVYDTEAREFPHPRSPRAIRAIAEKWGSTAGLPAAEAFQVVRSIQP